MYGSYGYDVQVSINGGGNTYSATHTEANRWDSQWPLEGWNYAISVRASGGDDIKGDYTATGTAEAKPQLAPPPQNVRVEDTSSGVTVSWDPPKGDYTDSIIGYNIIYWDWEPCHCQYIAGAAFKSSPGAIKWLTPAINYMIAVVTWNENGQGLPIFASNVVPGAGTPPVPSGLVVDTIDPTSVR